MIQSRDSILENLKGALAGIGDTSKIDEEIQAKAAEIDALDEEARALVNSNAEALRDQDAFNAEYSRMEERYGRLVSELGKLQERRKETEDKRNRIRVFLKMLEDKQDVITEFDEQTWNIMIREAVVRRDRSIRFVFNSGYEILIEAEE